MLQEEDQKLIGLFFKQINDEFFLGEAGDENFWKNVYQNLSMERRCDLWLTKIVQYEHRVGGEFNQESVEGEVVFLHKAITEKDNEALQMIDRLSEKLRRNALQSEKISQFMARRFQEL